MLPAEPQYVCSTAVSFLSDALPASLVNLAKQRFGPFAPAGARFCVEALMPRNAWGHRLWGMFWNPRKAPRKEGRVGFYSFLEMQ